MELITTYPAAVNSKATVTMGVLDQAATIVEVLDATVLPEAPNLLVLGTDQTAETVLMTAKENNTLTIQRAVQGIAKSWPAGTQIARNFTGKDWDDMRSNVEALFNELVSLIVDGVVPVNKGGTGAKTAAEALSNLGALGKFTLQPITKTSDDTSQKWLEVGSCIAFYYTDGLLNNQPSQYGFLLNFATEDQIFQIWKVMHNGSILHRGGNAYGSDLSNSAWIELADASKVLSLTGGTLSGTLNFFADRGSVGTEYDTSVTSTYLRSLFGDESYLIDVSNYGIRYFKGTKEDKFKNSYSIFGEHNKPSGSYTGNGSATSRTINVGGIGKFVAIKNNSVIVIASSGGAVLFHLTSSSIIYYASSTINFSNGVLTIASSDTKINSTNGVYEYQVL